MTKKKQGGKKPGECPKCGAAKIVPLVFGLPLPETEEKASRGEIVIGGCCCWGDERDNKWVCRKCGHEFGGKNPDRG